MKLKEKAMADYITKVKQPVELLHDVGRMLTGARNIFIIILVSSYRGVSVVHPCSASVAF